MVYCDNQSYIKLSKNIVFNYISKHIDMWHHPLWDFVHRHIILLQYILIEEQDANILTKALSRGKFEFQMCRIGVVDNPLLVEREC